MTDEIVTPSAPSWPLYGIIGAWALREAVSAVTYFVKRWTEKSLKRAEEEEKAKKDTLVQHTADVAALKVAAERLEREKAANVDLAKLVAQLATLASTKELELVNARIAELDKDWDEKLAETEKRLDDTINGVDRTVMQAASDVKNALMSVEHIRGAILETKNHVETRFEKQSEFYRGQVKEMLDSVEKQLTDLESRLRADTTRAMADSLPRDDEEDEPPRRRRPRR